MAASIFVNVQGLVLSDTLEYNGSLVELLASLILLGASERHQYFSLGHFSSSRDIISSCAWSPWQAQVRRGRTPLAQPQHNQKCIYGIFPRWCDVLKCLQASWGSSNSSFWASYNPRRLISFFFFCLFNECEDFHCVHFCLLTSETELYLWQKKNNNNKNHTFEVIFQVQPCKYGTEFCDVLALLAICSVSTTFHGLRKSFLPCSSHPFNHLQESENKVRHRNWALMWVRGRWVETGGEALGGFWLLQSNGTVWLVASGFLVQLSN